jgi:S-DNA-T family DNA segregation ATPase FtsK/SpoIIIE
LQDQAKPEYNVEIVEKPQGLIGLNDGVLSGDDTSEGSDDELLEEAKVVIIRAQKASASLLQRRLRVGYARAARLLDLLEEQGVIGPGDGAKPRDVLVRGNPNEGIPIDPNHAVPTPELDDTPKDIPEDQP